MASVAEKVAFVKHDVIELNDKFHNKKLLGDSFYKQLMQAGFAYRQCALVEVFPDSGNTYCGAVIKQDGKVFEFDIDLDDPDYSLFKDVSESFEKIRKERSKTKPWQKELVTYEFFKSIALAD